MNTMRAAAMQADEATDVTLQSGRLLPELLAQLKSASAEPSPEFGEWVSAIVTNKVEAVEAEQPMSLRERPLENWTKLKFGETTTLSGGRATMDLLAEVRRQSAAGEVASAAASRRTPWLILLCAFLCAVIAVLLIFRR